MRGDDAFDTDDHGLDLIVHPDGRREWKDVEHLSELVTSGRMTGAEVLGVLHAAAAVSARLDRDERWWASWDQWAPSDRVMLRRSSDDRPPAPLHSGHDR